jgi:hypothetical protein
MFGFKHCFSMRAVRNETATLNRVVQKRIADQLRAMYDETMEHVPSRHLNLLQRFERIDAPEQVAVPQRVPESPKSR